MRVKRLFCSFLAFALVLSTMSFSAFASETTDSVDTVTELVAAIENASDGDVIKIAPCTLDFKTETVESITIDKAITIQGAGKSETKLVFASDKSALVIASSKVTIKDLSIEQEKTTDNASHITVPKGAWDAPKVQYSDITINNVAFEGGKYGMFLTAEDVTVTNCVFSGIDSHHIIIYSVRGNSNIINNIFGADTGDKNRHAILFEGGADGLNTSEDWFDDFVAGGTLNISDNTVDEKGCLFVFTNWGLVKDMKLLIKNNTVNNFDNKVVALDVADGTEDVGDEFSKIEINENVLILSANASDRPYFRDQRTNSDVNIDATYNYYGENPVFDTIIEASPTSSINYVPYYSDAEKKNKVDGEASIGDMNYLTWEEAVENVEVGQTIEISTDEDKKITVKKVEEQTYKVNEAEVYTAADTSNGIEITVPELVNYAIENDNGKQGTYSVIAEKSSISYDEETAKISLDISLIYTPNGDTPSEVQPGDGQTFTVMIKLPDNADLSVIPTVRHKGEEISGVKVVDGYVVFETDSFSPFDISYRLRSADATDVDELQVAFEFDSETENEKVYNINLTAGGNVINRLNSVDLTFLFSQIEGANEYEIIASNPEVVINPVDNSKDRYEFHYDGKTAVETDTARSITIGQVKFTGYGKFSFAVDANANDTNAVHATKLSDNIVDTFVPGGVLEDGTEVGDLDISDDTITDIEITVPTRTLTIDITFPNAVENNVADYQDMTVTIVGGTVNETIALGTDGEAYNFTREFPYNTAYTVTVSGAGYRTARYTVNLNDESRIVAMSFCEPRSCHLNLSS